MLYILYCREWSCSAGGGTWGYSRSWRGAGHIHREEIWSGDIQRRRDSWQGASPTWNGCPSGTGRTTGRYEEGNFIIVESSWAESNPLSCHTISSLKTVTVQFCMYWESERVVIGNELNDYNAALASVTPELGTWFYSFSSRWGNSWNFYRCFGKQTDFFIAGNFTLTSHLLAIHCVLLTGVVYWQLESAWVLRKLCLLFFTNVPKLP